MKINILKLSICLFLTSNLFSQSHVELDGLIENEDYLGSTIIYCLHPQSQQSNGRVARYSQVQQPSSLAQLGVSELKSVLEESGTTTQRGGRGQINSSEAPLLYRISIHPELDLSEALELLNEDPAIAYAEPHYIHHTMKKTDLVPNDYDAVTQYYLERIEAENAWDITTGSASIKVGIVDSGFELTHEDLVGRFSDAQDLGDGSTSDVDTDLSGDPHGMYVAGCGFAAGNNNLGITGAAYGCTFVPVKTSIGAGASIVYGYNGVLYAAQVGCKVINMSWGRTGEPSRFEKDFLRYVVDTYDVVLIAAAGNGPTDAGYYYPAAYEETISVGATDASDSKVSGFNYDDRIDIVAPGINIHTTFPSNSYSNFNISGTSYSAPIVAAVAGLIYSQNPTSTAAQVKGRLLATTDIVQANMDFPGQLGTGRLNAYKALTETNLKFIETTNARTTAATGDNLNLIFDFQNLLSATADLQVSLSSSSSFITISDANSRLGGLNSTVKVNNLSDPFTFQIAQNMPENSLVTFQLTFTDGGFSQTEYITLELSPQPNYLTLGINEAIFSSGQTGRVGVYDFLSPNAKGLNYQNYMILPELALMLGTSETQLSHAVELGNGTPINPSFTNISNIHYTSRSNDTFQETVTSFEDRPNNLSRVGVEIVQYAYAWRDAPNSQFVIVEFQVRNISGSDIATLPIALFADWDLLYWGTNRTDWQAGRNLAYAYSTQSNGFYAGIRLLTEQDPIYYAMDKDGANGSLQINDDFTATEKYTTLSGGIARTQAGVSGDGNDIAQVVGGDLGSLAFGETKSIALALLVGEDLNDLEVTADAALQKFQEFKTGMIPTFSNTEVCAGQDFILKPDNGSLFKFYSKLPITNPLNLIAKSTSLSFNNITVPQTFYVTNVDSLYESEASQVDIIVEEVEADFMMSDTIVELSTEGGNVNFIASGTDLVIYDWDFGNGNTANTADVSSFFDTAQEYIIKLTATNSRGCSQLIQKRLTVVGELPPITGVEDFEKLSLKVYPNPFMENLQIESNEGISKLWIWDVKGHLIEEKTLTTSVHNLTLTHLEKGIYLIGIEDKQGRFYLEKVVKN